MKRRSFIVGIGTTAVTVSGCLSNEQQPAHTVTVYLSEREATRDVTVTVENESGEILFNKEYALSDSNEADEDATFPESTEPETVIVEVDGNAFERQWPGFEQQELPCNDGNWAGIELWIEGQPDEEPSVRMETNCQHVTMEEV